MSALSSDLDGAIRLKLPISEGDVRKLKAGDFVLLNGDIVITAGLPTHQRIKNYVDAGKPLPMDLTGGTLFHLGSYSQEQNGAFEVLYMNPTTSTRFNPFMPDFIRRFNLSMVGGKGGLDWACAEAMKEIGCVYLSFLGGGSALHSAAIKAVRQVAWDDLVAHYRLVKLKVENLGPLVVGIDSHGNSSFEQLGQQARERMPEILRGLDAARAKASS